MDFKILGYVAYSQESRYGLGAYFKYDHLSSGKEENFLYRASVRKRVEAAIQDAIKMSLRVKGDKWDIDHMDPFSYDWDVFVVVKDKLGKVRGKDRLGPPTAWPYSRVDPAAAAKATSRIKAAGEKAASDEKSVPPEKDSY